MPTALEQAGALRRDQHQARSMSDNNQSESFDKYDEDGQRVGLENFDNGFGANADVVGEADVNKGGEKKQPERNEGNVREQQAQARKKQDLVADKLTGGLGVEGVRGLVKDAYNGDAFAVAGAVITNPKVMTEIWATVIPSFGLTIFALDFIFLYDSFHEKRLPMWQQMAIVLVTLVYLTLIAIIIAATYEYYSIVFKIAIGIARSLGIIE